MIHTFYDYYLISCFQFKVLKQTNQNYKNCPSFFVVTKTGPTKGRICRHEKGRGLWLGLYTLHDYGRITFLREYYIRTRELRCFLCQRGRLTKHVGVALRSDKWTITVYLVSYDFLCLDGIFIYRYLNLWSLYKVHLMKSFVDYEYRKFSGIE